MGRGGIAGAEPDWAWASTSGEKNLKRWQMIRITLDVSFDDLGHARVTYSALLGNSERMNDWQRLTWQD